MKTKKKTKVSLGVILFVEIMIVSVLFLYVIRDKDANVDIGADELPVSSFKDGEVSLPGEDSEASTNSGAVNDNVGVDTADIRDVMDNIETATIGDTSNANPDSIGEGDTSDVNLDSVGEGDTEDDPVDVFDTITISAAGDVTLGRDADYGYERSFDHEFEVQGKDYSYFFRNVKDIFEADDLTIVNLETTLTTANKPAEKRFRFKADPSYVEILRQGDIEVVSIANNHTLDYHEQGYIDTLATLEEAKVGYFGYEHQYMTEVRGIKIGIIGYECWKISKSQKEEIKQAMDNLREEGADLVIVMFHWGIERDYLPYSVQQEMAHFVIDNGADLVLGGHPHVLQGIEEYNGKNIIYSLGNFSFGGNKNPDDKDTMVYVHKFNFKNGELVSQENEIIPCSISSMKDRNNYQPTPLEGSEKERVLNKIMENSEF